MYSRELPHRLVNLVTSSFFNMLPGISKSMVTITTDCIVLAGDFSRHSHNVTARPATPGARRLVDLPAATHEHVQSRSVYRPLGEAVGDHTSGVDPWDGPQLVPFQ